MNNTFVIADNQEIKKFPDGFWKGLYGESVYAIGTAYEDIVRRPIHKGNFVDVCYTNDTSYESIFKEAFQSGADRIVLIGAKVSVKDVDCVNSISDLEKIIFETHTPIYREWKDATMYLLAGGPSLPFKELQEGILDGKKILGVNRAVLLGIDMDALFFGDTEHYWGGAHQETIDFPGLKISTNKRWHRYRSLIGIPGIQLVRIGQARGLDPRPDRVAWNRTSGGCAIDVAVHMGATRIILLGYNQQEVRGEAGWYAKALEGQSKDRTFSKRKVGMYDHTIQPFDAIAKDAEKRGIIILNATPDSAIKCFKKVRLEDTL